MPSQTRHAFRSVNEVIEHYFPDHAARKHRNQIGEPIDPTEAESLQEIASRLIARAVARSRKKSEAP